MTIYTPSNFKNILSSWIFRYEVLQCGRVTCRREFRWVPARLEIPVAPWVPKRLLPILKGRGDSAGFLSEVG